MKCSGEIVWELGDVLKSKGNPPVSYVGIYGLTNDGYKSISDKKFGFNSKTEAENLPGALLEISMSKVISGMDIIEWVDGQYDQSCELAVWVEDSEDGVTNIDDKVVEAFSKLKWEK